MTAYDRTRRTPADPEKRRSEHAPDMPADRFTARSDHFRRCLRSFPRSTRFCRPRSGCKRQQTPFSTGASSETKFYNFRGCVRAALCDSARAAGFRPLRRSGRSASRSPEPNKTGVPANISRIRGCTVARRHMMTAESIPSTRYGRRSLSPLLRLHTLTTTRNRQLIIGRDHGMGLIGQSSDCMS